MNAARRTRIQQIIDRLSIIGSELESLRDEEQEAFDNMPESLQSSERGEKSQECIDALDTACSDCESLESNLTDIL